MNNKELIKFLKKFNINEDKINLILKDKEIIEKEKNIFLINSNEVKTFSNNKFFQDKIIYIDLKQLLPTKFLLRIIDKNSKNKIEVKSEKQAIEFTYGKSLSLKSIINKYQLKFGIDEYYLVKYENDILGYFSFNPDNKSHPLKNIMNIGEYLLETK